MPIKTDARIRYTRMVIRNAFLQLLLKKPIKQITVKELCEIAEINRATFYSHYTDVYDLLEHIQNELYVQLEEVFDKTMDNSINNIVEKVLVVIHEHAELCKILFSENGDKMFFRKIQDAGEKTSIAYWQSNFPKASMEQLKAIYIYISSGSVSLIDYWINTGMKESPEVIGKIIGNISKHAILSLEEPTL